MNTLVSIGPFEYKQTVSKIISILVPYKFETDISLFLQRRIEEIDNITSINIRGPLIGTSFTISEVISRGHELNIDFPEDLVKQAVEILWKYIDSKDIEIRSACSIAISNIGKYSSLPIPFEGENV